MSKKAKQISYLSAIVMSIGSTIGAGIFFKNGSIFNNVGGSLGLMITAWIVAGIGVLALGLALVEMSTASKKDGGILEWARKFLPKRLSKMSASYMLLIYLPINYLAMPLYVVSTFQDALKSFDPSIEINGWLVALMSFGLFMFVAFFDWYRYKASEKMQVYISWIKFLPLLIVMGFAIYATSQSGAQTHISGASTIGLTAYSPSLGILASIPAILFAYDGFYAITSLKTELKEEKKLGSVMALGVAIITAAYVTFGVITGLTGEKTFNGFIDIKWVLFTVNILIMFAVFAILNSFALITYRMYEDVYKEEPIGIVGFFARIFKIKDAKYAAFITSVVLGIAFYIVLIPVGIYGFDEGDYPGYGSGAGNLYNLADMLTNYTSLMVFVIIAASVVGAMVNRKTNKVKVERKWYFLPAAWIAVIFAFSGAIYMVVDNIAGMAGVNANHDDQMTEITKFVILAVTLLVTVIQVAVHDFRNKKRQTENIDTKAKTNETKQAV